MTADRPQLLAFGDSLTAGYGLAPDESFAARLQALLHERWPGAGVVNAGVSGDTTRSALARLPRVLSALTVLPALAIVELGANDVLRGLAPEQTEANLDAIVRELARCGMPVLVASLTAPALLGPVATRFNGIHARVADRHGAAIAPFFPPGVMGRPDLVLRDRLHPNAAAIDRCARGLLPAVVAAIDRGRAGLAA